MTSPTRRALPTRRTLLGGSALTAGAALMALSGCASATSSAAEYSTEDPLPSGEPDSTTSLRLAGRTTELQLAAAGDAIDPLAFTVSEWVNVGAGPDVIQAFRADSLDVASNAILPPIQAHAIGFDTRIVGVLERPTPSYIFATSAASGIAGFEDFRGKRIAFSQGQSQGDTVLRTLRRNGIANEEVELIDLPSTEFVTALQGDQVDVAPLGEPTLTKYIEQYGVDGAITLPSEVPDLLSIIWAPTSVLAEEANVLAIRDYLRAWAQGNVWAWENPDAWKQAYYVEDQGVTAEDADRIWETVNTPLFPESWDRAVEWAASSIDLLVEGGFIEESFDAEELFDRRFETDAAAAVDATYTRAADEAWDDTDEEQS
ncbi:ABC transporter substrate-binding protein [Brachybacterium sp. DNPG3]